MSRGAPLREKIVHSAAKQIVIATESCKFVPSFSWIALIEIYPFAIHIVRKKFEEIGQVENEDAEGRLVMIYSILFP